MKASDYETIKPAEIKAGDLIWVGSPNPARAGFHKVTKITKGADKIGTYHRAWFEDVTGHRTWRPRASIYRSTSSSG
jgi:hypothetical protein